MENSSDTELVLLEAHLAIIFQCIDENNTGHPNFALIPILKTCFDLTKDYDESHNLNHHVSVVTNAIEIFSYEYLHGGKISEPRDLVKLRKIIIYASLLHDTIDYKYPNNLEEKGKILVEFLREKLADDWIDVKWVIDNISYSKEIKNGYPQHTNFIVQIARDIVSDADKLEAIGSIGITRCKRFNLAMNPLITEEELVQVIVNHGNEKLIKLKDNFIRTTHGKLMAEPLHQIIVDYISLHTQKTEKKFD